jgi:hypothetical protein
LLIFTFKVTLAALNLCSPGRDLAKVLNGIRYLFKLNQ